MQQKKFMCNDCNRQFVDSPSSRTSEDEEWDMAGKLLLERMPIPSLSRAVDSSRGWLREHAEAERESVSNIPFRMSTKAAAGLEADQLWSFAGSKENGAWAGLAIGRTARPVGGFFVVGRDAEGALGLWNSLSEDCKNNGSCSADGLQACKSAFPEARPGIAGKKSGTASPVGRPGSASGQRTAPFVRKTFCFLEKLKICNSLLPAVSAAAMNAKHLIDHYMLTVTKIPSNVLEEDPKLFMWHDQAATRMGGE